MKGFIILAAGGKIAVQAINLSPSQHGRMGELPFTEALEPTHCISLYSLTGDRKAAIGKKKYFFFYCPSHWQGQRAKMASVKRADVSQFPSREVVVGEGG